MGVPPVLFGAIAEKVPSPHPARNASNTIHHDNPRKTTCQITAADRLEASPRLTALF
jgi:hypothetical protein